MSISYYWEEQPAAPAPSSARWLYDVGTKVVLVNYVASNLHIAVKRAI